MGIPIISTQRLILRHWIDTDVPPFIEMNKDAAVMQYFPSTLTEQETLAFVARIHAGFDANKFGLYAVALKATGEFIGFTGFSIPRFESFFTPCVEIGWRLNKTAWGNGYATEAAKACLQYGFEVLGFNNVYSFTAAINTPSEKVMRNIGMGKAGEFDHPNVEAAHVLCRHVLYKIEKAGC